MSSTPRFRTRPTRKGPKARPLLGRAFESGTGGGAALAAAFPGFGAADADSGRAAWVTTLASAGTHLGALALLALFASMAPEVAEEIISVRLLPEPQVERETAEPAPAPRALAERRLPNFAPQVQSVAPQIVNPRVVAEAAPVVEAAAIDMQSIASVAAPREVRSASAPVVERVSVINSPAAARAASVDVQGLGAPAVRGPLRVDAPAGASVGPRQVAVGAGAPSLGTGTLQIGAGSSVQEGRITGRDVVGSPTGEPLVRIDATIGEGLTPGSGGSGSSLAPAGGKPGALPPKQCFEQPAVQSYLASVQQRAMTRWILPPGSAAGQQVRIRFQIDAAGSASRVALVKASDNALGASAVDALRAASPFPAIPEAARCLSGLDINATFSNPVAN